MTISESKTRELEARGTTGSTIARTAALGLALIIAQHSLPHRDVTPGAIKLTGTEGTISQPMALQINELDVFSQINRVYDDLLRNQVELDSDSKRALYTNLWDLYT
jgi:hypothetical protein